MINVFQVGETDTGIGFVREEWPLLDPAIVGTIVGVVFLSWFSTSPLIPFLIDLIVIGYVIFICCTVSTPLTDEYSSTGSGNVEPSESHASTTCSRRSY